MTARGRAAVKDNEWKCPDCGRRLGTWWSPRCRLSVFAFFGAMWRASPVTMAVTTTAFVVLLILTWVA